MISNYWLEHKSKREQSKAAYALRVQQLEAYQRIRSEAMHVIDHAWLECFGINPGSINSINASRTVQAAQRRQPYE